MREAFFIDGGAGRIFCTAVRHDASRALRGAVLLCPPFAEEMNKSRHVMAALGAQLGQAGYDVLQPDLYGTGDSQGEFADADLGVWRDDLDAAIAHLGDPPGLHLVGLRTGALLAADVARRQPVASMTLVQPVPDGRQQLTQFLRLRLAAGMMAGGERETVGQLRDRLASGTAVEVAGYLLSGRLATGLESLHLTELSPRATAWVHWIELAVETTRPLLPASQRVISAWAEQGVATRTSVVACDHFWSTQEIAHCPAVVSTALAPLAA